MYKQSVQLFVIDHNNNNNNNNNKRQRADAGTTGLATSAYRPPRWGPGISDRHAATKARPLERTPIRDTPKPHVR